ncbi:IS630-like element ISMsm2 family transposase [soil metagenome]
MPVTVTDAQREQLWRLLEEGGDRERRRARIVLGAAQGRSNRELAEEVGCSEPTVSVWRGRFAERGVAGLAHAGGKSSAGARRGRPLARLEVSDTDRAALGRWTRRHTVSQALALRARIVLAAAEGGSNTEIAAREGCNAATVGKWRQRYLGGGVDALLDEPRVGRAREIDDDQVEQIVVDTLQAAPPEEATHWSTRTMARHADVSQTFVSRVWRAFGLKPHLVDTWKLSTDPQFVEKVRDVVGLYLDPPERAVVLCVDEKSQTQALARTQPILPLLPTSPARASHDYKRNGTTDLFAALDVATGRVHTQMHARHRTTEFRKFLNHLDKQVPDEFDVHLVLDNYATHKTPAIHRWLLRHPRFHLHFTPTSSSWLNLVERWFGELTDNKLRRSSHDSVKELTDDINAWTAAWNANPKPYTWVKTAPAIFESIGNYCQRISNSGHSASPTGAGR